MSLVKTNGNVLNYSLPSILDDFFGKGINWSNNKNNSSVPAVNIKETPASFNVEVAAPGLDKKDFKIELDKNMLTISSQKQEQQENKEGETYNRKEFSYQSFSRTFHLPKNVVDTDNIAAKYENGLLSLAIPKREEAKEKPARVIDIA